MRELMDRTNMEAALRERLESDEWDVNIARSVMARSEQLRKRGNLKKKIAWLATPLVTAAAALLIAFFVQDYRNERMRELDRVIASQINGTYYNVFNEGLKEARDPQALQGLYDDSIDEMIDDVLASRYAN